MAATELNKRIATAVVGVSALLALITIGGWIGTFIFVMVISLGMIFEFSKIVFALPDHSEKTYGLLILSWFAAFACFVLPMSEFEILVFSWIALFTYFLITARRYEGPDFTAHFKELMYAVFGLLYLVFVPSFINKIRGSVNGANWTLLFLFIVWSMDTGAYFAGRKYGKTPLYAKISPKKTREGLYGGLALSVVVTLIFKLVTFRELGWVGVLFIPIIVGGISQVGDLCESFLKRAFDKKDSGSILPGHGGFLDRFDGVVFSVPVMYALSRVFS